MPSSRRATLAVIALALGAFTFVTTEVLPSGLLTVIAPDLHRSVSQVGLLVTGYALVVLVVSLPLAHVTRAVPRRHLLGATLLVLAVTTAVAAAAHSLGALLAARLVTALAQATFWAVVFPAAGSLVPEPARGRAVSRVAVGSALATVLGVPAGTWLGQHAGWRASFAALSALGLLTCAAVVASVPTTSPHASTAARGTRPDRLRFATLLVTVVLAVTGAMTTFTYVTPFLLHVAGFPASALSVLLLAQGCAGVVGALLVGRTLDRAPWASLVALLALLAGALAVLGAFGRPGTQVVAVGALAATGLAFSAFPAVLQHRVMRVAPGSTDLASAATSSCFNVGIAAGSAAGALLVARAGVGVVPLVGGAVVGLALATTLAEPVLRVGEGRLRRQAGHATIGAWLPLPVLGGRARPSSSRCSRSSPCPP